MKCTIPGNHVKVFGRAIHSLSKIGEELYVEPLEHGLTLRTVNSSRSAYACFVFAPDFFHYYDDGSALADAADSEDDTLRCKITMKSCLTVFKSLSTIEKTVERCKVTLSMKECKLTFQLYCKHGIVKTHNLSFIECETLQAVFSKDMCPNILTAHARLLADVVGNFQTSQEEVTLIVNADKIAFKNYVDDEPDPQKVMHTELNLDPSEFDSCQIGTNTDVTFCLKELRAILAFAEANNLPVTINFDTAGKPIVFTIPGDKGFEANFVLATLADLQSSNSQQRSVSQKSKLSKSKSGGGDTITEEPSRIDNKSTNRSRQPTRVENGSGDGPSHNPTAERFEAAYQELMEDDMDMELTAVADVTMTTTEPCPSTSKESAKLHPSTSKGMSRPSASVGKNNSSAGKETPGAGPSKTEVAGHSTSAYKESSSVLPALKKTTGSLPSAVVEDHNVNDRLQPVIPKPGDDGKKRGLETTLCDDSSDHSDDLDDTIPGTPPSKKFKSLFFGWSQSTTQASQANRAAAGSVLVEDSDED